jgi:hypothetical protein
MHGANNTKYSEDICGFPEPIQANIKAEPQQEHAKFSPRPFRSIIQPNTVGHVL